MNQNVVVLGEEVLRMDMNGKKPKIRTLACYPRANESGTKEDWNSVGTKTMQRRK